MFKSPENTGAHEPAQSPRPPMAEVSRVELDKLRTVAPGDPRLAVAAVLMAASEIIGKVTVLSPQIAVTTAEVANSARAKVEALASERASSVGPLILAFPQFEGSPGVYRLPVEIQAVDKERGFGVLHLSLSRGAQN